MATGKGFELVVLNALRQALKSRQLPLMAKYCEIFHHKGYYSRDRRSEIIVDISIEIFLPKASRPSILWIWECKDYKHAVPVDDVEEFHAKLEQIGADKTKGTIISRGPFQKGAIEFARAKGIGVARFLADCTIDHVAFRFGGEIQEAEHEPEHVMQIMTSDVPTYNDFYAFKAEGTVCKEILIEQYAQKEFIFYWTIASMNRAIARLKRTNAIRKFFGLPPKPLPPPELP